MVQKKWTTSISYLKNTKSIYQNINQKTGEIKYAKIDINQNNIANGIVQVIATFASGEISEICQKLNIITGSAKVMADIVKTKASRIAKVSGKKEKIFLKKSCVKTIHKTAKKLKWKEIS